MSVSVTYVQQDNENEMLAQGVADHVPAEGMVVRFADLVTGELAEQRWRVTNVVHGVFQRPGFDSRKTYLGATARVLCIPIEVPADSAYNMGLRDGMSRAANIAASVDGFPYPDEAGRLLVVYGIGLAEAAIRAHAKGGA